MINALAACDKHLVSLLLKLVPEGKTRKVRVSNLAKPDENYTCICRVPAQWYITSEISRD